MIEIIRGFVGEHKKGDRIALSAAMESRLVSRGMAKSVSDSDTLFHPPEIIDDDPFERLVGKTEEESDDFEDLVKKFKSKEAILNYAQSLGISLSNNRLKDMKEELLNVLQEQREMQEKGEEDAI